MPVRSGSSGSTRRRLFGAAVSVLLFAGAVFVLRSELRQHSLSEILDELRGFSPLRLFLALAATLLSFLALAGYDAVSLSALGRRLAFRRVAYAAFLGYAFANTLPLSVVTGAAVRYRLYSQWGLDRAETARVITLNTVTYVAGLLASAGLAFALQPVLVPGFLRLPLHSARPLGVVCLAVVAAYLAWSSRSGGDLRLWRWELPRPTLRRALAQIVGLVAQIPAGLGVFEAVMLVGLTPALSTPAILVGLVGYRLVYFLLPLLLATGIWVLHEGRRWYRATR